MNRTYYSHNNLFGIIFEELVLFRFPSVLCCINSNTDKVRQRGRYMEYSLEIIRHMFSIIIQEFYPYTENFQQGFYSLEHLLDQLIFEFLKEENKKYGVTKTITYYLSDDDYEYDKDGNPAQYSKAIRRIQKTRDFDNDRIEGTFGTRLDELNSIDMSSPKRFIGYGLRRDEFLQYWLDYQTDLFKKLHGHQISNSHKVSNSQFICLFDQYYTNINRMMPRMNQKDLLIPHTMAFYGIETHFLIHFLYNVTLSAEKYGFPEPIPTERILDFCSITPYMPEVEWCPELFVADFPMLMRWHDLTDYIFTDDSATWKKLLVEIIDCKRIKNVLLQKHHDQVVDIIHQCPVDEKIDFIIEHYWCWDTLPIDGFEWNDQRISYFRKVYDAVTEKTT